jgi:hypothetical protein
MDESYLIGYDDATSWVKPKVINQEPYHSNLERLFALTLTICISYILYILLKNSVCIAPKDYVYYVFTVFIFLIIIIGFIGQVLNITYI